ncbi:MAG TPA: UbiA family prenyltransferase, partial [Prolixibacteraceae bacterium]|nr:UbiA family prenyltransferase [Prolixibacteraceae bacterium]
KSTVKHLRLPFSFFLMPVFLFALSQADAVNWQTTIIAFVIMHLLVFPSSNGYNSFQDRDETSIGGLKYPPKVTKNLFYATLFMDIVGVLCGLFVSAYFSLLVLIFVLVSRAYSYRKVRLKKYAVIGFLTVFIFQGAFVYLMSSAAISTFSFATFFMINNIICMSIASFFIGSIYPLTQIYQHEADKNDGVISISYKLGYIGTFLFSSILFSVATIFLFYYFNLKNQQIALVLFLVIMLPVVIKLGIWFNQVRKDTVNANFENTMAMNLLTSSCMNLYFLVLILNNYYTWF